MELRYLFKKTDYDRINYNKVDDQGVSENNIAGAILSPDKVAASKREAKKKITVEEVLVDNSANVPYAPEGILSKCTKCGKAVFTDDLLNNFNTCPACGHHNRVNAMDRIQQICEEDSFEAWDSDFDIENPLNTPGYEDKITSLREKTGLNEAVVTGKCKIGSNDAVLCVMDTRFMMASMGRIVGEKITRAVEKATSLKLPIIIFTCSGGARMQEGIMSLMQMAKTSAALKRHSEAGLLYITVLTDPTTGGVSASFAMLGDIILAEPDALVGFAGPRVIEQTIGQKLPEGFQRSEFLLNHGLIDAVVNRKDMKDTLENILTLHKESASLSELQHMLSVEHNKFAKNCRNTVRATNSKKNKLTAWDKVCLSREKHRPVAHDYINRLFPDFIELHGDREFGDDGAICGGIASFKGIPVTVIAQCKGKNTTENIKRNFGMPSPEGYRKALRLMKQAEKFNRPIILFVDTPGAFCGLEAEERGQAGAIAYNLYDMFSLQVPIYSCIIGEGGSGGALAMAVADEVWMLSNAIYAILSPEGYASILWKNSELANKAAEEMKLTADDLLKLKIIDGIIDEPEKGLTVSSFEEVAEGLYSAIAGFLCNAASKPADIEYGTLRYERYRKF